MRKAAKLLLILAGVAVFGAIGPACRAQSPAPAAENPAVAARKLIDGGQYTEALTLVDGALKSGAAGPELKMCQVDALLGLRKVMEARQVALANLAMGPGFRFKAGVCSAKFGRMAEAVDIWKPLYANKEWAEAAYRESVTALMAIGKEKEARALLSEALQKVPGTPVSLWSLSLTVNLGAETAKTAVERLKATDPQNASRWDTWARIYAAAGGDLLQESFEGAPPAAITLKEKTERVEANTLAWGGSGGTKPIDSAGAGSIATSSGQQGYGAGSKDTSSKEGGKTGLMTSHPRVVVDARLNGDKVEPMVIDTGSEAVLLTSRVAKKLNLENLGPGEYSGMGLTAPIPSNWVLLKELRVGPLTVRNVPALVIDPKAEFWKETAGILPLWLFRHYGLHYDRRHSKLDLFPSGTSPDQALGAGSSQTKVLWFDSKPYFETRIQDKPACFMLLGSNSVATYLELRRLAELGVTVQTSKYGTQQARGFYGIISSGVADNVTLYIGPTRINLPTVHVADLCPDCGVDCYGVLGRNIEDLFDFYLDYPANILAFKGYEKGK